MLQKLREFQDAGHTVVLIIGDFTARIGDPSGRSALRPVLEPEEIDRNARTFQEQAFKVLDESRTEVRRNGEWLDMPMDDLLRLVRNVTLARVTERDDFAQRIAEGRPISVLELLYPVMQGYDSVAVQSDVELGGTDQKFNLLLGRDVQQAYGQEPQAILTMPILPGLDGERRMSKSYGNYIGVTEPPEEIFGKTMRVPDDAMGTYYELLAGTEPDPALKPVEQKRALAQAAGGPLPRARGGRGRRAALRPRAPRPPAARGGRGGRGLPRRPSGRRRAPAGAAGRPFRRLPQRGPAAAGRGRGPPRRGAAGSRTSSTSRPARLDGGVLQVGPAQVPAGPPDRLTAAPGVARRDPSESRLYCRARASRRRRLEMFRQPCPRPKYVAKLPRCLWKGG